MTIKVRIGVISGRAGVVIGRDLMKAAGGWSGSLLLPRWWLDGRSVYKLLTCTLSFECIMFSNEHRFREKTKGHRNILKEMLYRFSSPPRVTIHPHVFPLILSF